MKELARFTLTPAQVKEACEAYIAPRMDPSCEEATATGIPANLAVVVVVNRKPAARKPRDRATPVLLAPGDGVGGAAGPVGSSS